MIFLALLPLILLITFLLVFSWPLARTAPVVFMVTAASALWFWDLPLSFLSSGMMKAALLTLDILIIIAGAILFLQFLKATGAMSSMQENLKHLSADKRVQGILLAWFFGGFLEGVSGFGTPAAIVAPLLVGLGFRPMTAILVALTANSTAVTFGAVGTPVRIGFMGMDLTGVPFKTTLVNFASGLMVPMLMLLIISREEYQDQWWPRVKEKAGWALFSGFAFLIPYTLASLVSYEFPSLVGGSVGMVIALTSLRVKVNLPSLLKAFGPYFLLVLILLLGKFFLSGWSYRVQFWGELTHQLQLFNPGMAFFTALLLLSLKARMPLRKLLRMIQDTSPILIKTSLTIFFISALVYTMIMTGRQGGEGMLELIIGLIMSPYLVAYSAFIGAFGSFLAGSATVSNLLFGELQAVGAAKSGLDVSIILALQLSGAAAGNMIALQNILAVEAAVGLEGEESFILKRLVVACLIYLIFVSISGVLLTLF